MSAAIAAVASPSPTTRSRVTNGSEMLPGIDGRSDRARRYRDLAVAFADELGGEAALSEPDKAAVRLAAALTVHSEDLQAKIVRGEAVDEEQLTRITNTVGRALAGLRKKRVTRSAGGPDLKSYLAERAAAT